MDIKEKVIHTLEEIFKEENISHIFPEDGTLNDKLQMLISESLIALQITCALEDEFEIEFEDDEVDYDFFSSIDSIVKTVQNHIK
ncbi:hypothetical protein [Chryseobacterium gleum]|uniref:hypothetical protein n=1 Tax=Chryseobacterium gleum TaxID=250 RepID=UPI0028AE1605|nr:hypothetical protein [Chryseobacterium gleum]